MDTDTLIASTPLAWVHYYKMVNENQFPIEFKDHYFLIDIYDDDADDKLESSNTAT